MASRAGDADTSDTSCCICVVQTVGYVLTGKRLALTNSCMVETLAEHSDT